MDERGFPPGNLPNRHAADRLSEVRARIKDLEREVSDLRAYLIRHPDDLTGADYVASVSTRNFKRVDLDSLRTEIGDAAIQRHTTTRAVRFVWLKERQSDAA
jgi:hypothetical protein